MAYSTNIHGGLGWWWHPPGNAWLCNSLWEHYEYTRDLAHVKRIYPLLKGACEFWETRLVTMTVTDAETGGEREVLVADSDWSPEHGPQDAKGITYAQEVVRQLFANYREASPAPRRGRHLRQDCGGARGAPVHAGGQSEDRLAPGVDVPRQPRRDHSPPSLTADRAVPR